MLFKRYLCWPCSTTLGAWLLLATSRAPAQLAETAERDLLRRPALVSAGLPPLGVTLPAIVAQPSERSDFAAEENRAIDIFGDTRFLFLGGFVSGGAGGPHGSRFGFEKLNADFGYNVGVGARFYPSAADTIEGRAAYYYLRGSATLDDPKTFEGTTFFPGTVLDTTPDWADFRLTWFHKLFGQPDKGGSLWFSLGGDWHYINWRFRGHTLPLTPRTTVTQDFYRQTLPLPVFGLRYLIALGPFAIDIRGNGFRANHWRHWDDSDGTAHTSSTVLDAIGTLRWRPVHGFFVEGGYAFSYYTLDLDGREENHLLAREHGPVAAVGFSW